MCRHPRLRTNHRARQDLITFVAVAALAFVGLVLPAAADAAPGDLDPTFGDNGQLEPGRSGASAVEVDSLGRYLLGTGGSNIAFDEQGSLDTGFGTNGTALGGPFFDIDSQARIVSGRTDGTIVRVHADGDTDTGFGDNGHIFVGELHGLAVQPDGAVIVMSTTPGTGGRGLRIRRYTATGDPDTSFGSNGAADVFPPDRPGGINVDGSDAVVTPDGGIVATGRIFYPAADFPASLAVKVTADGDLDTSFGGGDGIAEHVQANDIKDIELLADGRLMLTGNSAVRFYVSVLLPDGTPDQDFGLQNGSAWIDWGTDGNPFCSRTRALDAEEDPDGGIVVVGTVGEVGPCPVEDSFSFGLARLFSDGTLDAGFGTEGLVSTEFSSEPTGSSAGSPRSTSVAIDSLGRILLSARAGDQRVALARFEGGEGDGGGGGGGAWRSSVRQRGAALLLRRGEPVYRRPRGRRRGRGRREGRTPDPQDRRAEDGRGAGSARRAGARELRREVQALREGQGQRGREGPARLAEDTGRPWQRRRRGQQAPLGHRAPDRLGGASAQFVQRGWTPAGEGAGARGRVSVGGRLGRRLRPTERNNAVNYGSTRPVGYLPFKVWRRS